MRVRPPEDGAERDEKEMRALKHHQALVPAAPCACGATRSTCIVSASVPTYPSSHCNASLLRVYSCWWRCWRSYARPFQTAGRDPQQQNAQLAVAGGLAVRDRPDRHSAAQCSRYGTCTLLYAGDLMFHWLASMSVPFRLFPFRRQVHALTRLS